MKRKIFLGGIVWLLLSISFSVSVVSAAGGCTTLPTMIQNDGTTTTCTEDVGTAAATSSSTTPLKWPDVVSSALAPQQKVQTVDEIIKSATTPSASNSVGTATTPATTSTATDTPSAATSTKPASVSTKTLNDDETKAQIERGNIDPTTGQWTDKAVTSWANLPSTKSLGDTEYLAEVKKGNIDPTTGQWTDKATGGSKSSTLPILATPDFKLNPQTFSPSTKEYTAGSGNIANMIGDLVRIMLIAISTLAVISIAIGGAMMAISWGDSDRVSKGKSILMHSLQALAVSLSSYFIIKFVSWVIG